MNLEYYVCSMKGNFREINEDNFFVNGVYMNIEHDDKYFIGKCSLNKKVCFGVFDGMGGEENGEEASYYAALALQESYAEDIQKFYIKADNDICAIKDGKKRAGSTAAILIFEKNYITATNIGDSRSYIIRDNKIRQLSVDHTVISNLLDVGVITREAAKNSPFRNHLTRYLGMGKDIKPYIYESFDIKENDIFVICTDGLSGIMSNEEICSFIVNNKGLPNIAYELSNAAYNKGGKDNTTVIIIYVRPSIKEKFLRKLFC